MDPFLAVAASLKMKMVAYPFLAVEAFPFQAGEDPYQVGEGPY